MKPSSHSEAPPSSSNSHSYRSPQTAVYRGRGRGRKEYIPQSRQDINYKRSFDDNNRFPRPYQPNRDNDDYREKRPRINDKDFNKEQPESSRNINIQRNTDGGFRPPGNSNYHERTPHVPCGAEMFYQSGRLPTGMYVNRNLNVDNSRNDDTTNDVPNNTTNESASNTSVPKAHFLLGMLPKSKKHVAVPFLQCNTEKASPKEPSTSKKSATKSKTSSTKTSEALAKSITEKEKEERRPSLEEIEREFQSFPTVKQEVFDNSNDDSDAQPPSFGGRECEAGLHPSPSIRHNHSIDFTSDTLPFNYQFSPAPNKLQYNFPDPSGVDAVIHNINNSVAKMRGEKADLMQESKDLTTRLHRVLTNIEVLDIQIDEMVYKASALRNQS